MCSYCSIHTAVCTYCSMSTTDVKLCVLYIQLDAWIRSASTHEFVQLDAWIREANASAYPRDVVECEDEILDIAVKYAYHNHTRNLQSQAVRGQRQWNRCRESHCQRHSYFHRGAVCLCLDICMCIFISLLALLFTSLSSLCKHHLSITCTITREKIHLSSLCRHHLSITCTITCEKIHTLEYLLTHHNRSRAHTRSSSSPPNSRTNTLATGHRIWTVREAVLPPLFSV